MRKKTLYVLMCALAISAMLGAGSAFADMVAKVGIDLSGTRDIEGSEKDVDQSYSAAVEFTKPIIKFLHLGVGVEGQLPRSAEGENGKFFFVPVYGVARVPIPLGLLTPYATAKLGYNFFFGDTDYKGAGGKLKGGIHYGVGAGVILFKFLLAEGDYSIYKGVHEFGGGSFDTTYKDFSIKAGIKF